VQVERGEHQQAEQARLEPPERLEQERPARDEQRRSGGIPAPRPAALVEGTAQNQREQRQIREQAERARGGERIDATRNQRRDQRDPGEVREAPDALARVVDEALPREQVREIAERDEGVVGQVMAIAGAVERGDGEERRGDERALRRAGPRAGRIRADRGTIAAAVARRKERARELGYRLPVREAVRPTPAIRVALGAGIVDAFERRDA
jgi:hypothetical protein